MRRARSKPPVYYVIISPRDKLSGRARHYAEHDAAEPSDSARAKMPVALASLMHATPRPAISRQRHAAPRRRRDAQLDIFSYFRDTLYFSRDAALRQYFPSHAPFSPVYFSAGFTMHKRFSTMTSRPQLRFICCQVCG